VRSEQWFRERAKALYHDEGEIEVDDNALVSTGADNGAYVEVWVWVDAELETGEGEGRRSDEDATQTGTAAPGPIGD